MNKLNKKLSWKLLLPLGVVLTLIGNYGGDNFVLITIGFLGNILMFIGLIGLLAYFGLWVTAKLRKEPKQSAALKQRPSSTWLVENWFKLGILILIAVVVAIYAYIAYQNQKPKTLEERVDREIIKRLDN